MYNGKKNNKEYRQINIHKIIKAMRLFVPMTCDLFCILNVLILFMQIL